MFSQRSCSYSLHLIFMLKPCLSDKALDSIFYWFEKLGLRNCFLSEVLLPPYFFTFRLTCSLFSMSLSYHTLSNTVIESSDTFTFCLRTSLFIYKSVLGIFSFTQVSSGESYRLHLSR